MRILMLGDSNDGGHYVEGPKRNDILRDRLVDLFDEPVEMFTRAIWPNPRLPAMVDGWVKEFQPDLVHLKCGTYWFQYESVPLRVRRLLGRTGTRVAGAGFRLADSNRWGHNAPFRGVRRLAQLVIGGDRPFTTRQVIDRVAEAIRVVLHDESAVLVVTGPQAVNRYGTTRARRKRNEQNRLEVDAALRRLCADLHVSYLGYAEPLYQTAPVPPSHRVGDGLHYNLAGHAAAVDRPFEHLSGAWLTHRAERERAGRK